MKAILTYTTMIGNEAVEETKLFDTAKAKKICDVVNAFKYKVPGNLHNSKRRYFHTQHK